VCEGSLGHSLHTLSSFVILPLILSHSLLPLVILEALGGTPNKRHRLVTLGGCRLLDGSGVVSVELSKKIVEKPRCRL
jgi:hypothetical protein